MDPDLYGDGPLRLEVAVTVGDDQLHADFTGTDPQASGSLNCPLASTVSVGLVRGALHDRRRRAAERGGLPADHHARPRGLPAESRLPRAGERAPPHGAEGRRPDAARRSCEACPERSAAGCSVSFPTFNVTGVDPRTGEPYLAADIVGGGMGGHAGGDGMSAVDTHMGNCAMMSAEAMEIEAPLRVLLDRAGPGLGRPRRAPRRPRPRAPVRGPRGPGPDRRAGTRTRRCRRDAPVGCRGRCPRGARRGDARPGRSSGARGPGQGSGPAAAPGATRSPCARAEAGGWGDPRRRPRDHVAADVRDGYVGAAQARDAYGWDEAAAPAQEPASKGDR